MAFSGNPGKRPIGSSYNEPNETSQECDQIQFGHYSQ